MCASSQMLSSEISVSGSATDARPIVARRPERSSRTAKVQSERRARRRPSPGSAPTMTQSSVSRERFTLSQPDPRRPGAYGACGAFTTKPSDPRCRDVMKAASIPSTPQTVSCVAARKTPPLFVSSCSDSSAARRSRYERCISGSSPSARRSKAIKMTWMRCCSASVWAAPDSRGVSVLDGSGRPSAQATISPSRIPLIPVAIAAAAISGKETVTS